MYSFYYAVQHLLSIISSVIRYEYIYYRVPLSSFMPAMREVKKFYKCASHAGIYIIQNIYVSAK